MLPKVCPYLFIASRHPLSYKYSMAKDDLIQLDGKISDVTGGGIYRVMLDNGVEVNARLCGKMKRFKIKVIVGDRVTVGVSPYDPTHGLITFRHKT